MLVDLTELTPVKEGKKSLTQAFSLGDYGKFLYITQSSGAVTGNCYYKGDCLATNPKTLVLLTGTLDLQYRKVSSSTLFKQILQGPIVIRINPYVVYQMTAVSDVSLLENNSFEESQEDRVLESVDSLEVEGAS